MLPIILCDGKDTAIDPKSNKVLCPELLTTLAEFKAEGCIVLLATDRDYVSYVYDIINNDKNFQLNSADIFTDSVKGPAANFSKMDKEYYQALSQQYNQPINTMVLLDDDTRNTISIIRAGGIGTYPFDYDDTLTLDHKSLEIAYQQALSRCTP